MGSRSGTRLEAVGLVAAERNDEQALMNTTGQMSPEAASGSMQSVRSPRSVSTPESRRNPAVRSRSGAEAMPPSVALRIRAMRNAATRYVECVEVYIQVTKAAWDSQSPIPETNLPERMRRKASTRRGDHEVRPWCCGDWLPDAVDERDQADQHEDVAGRYRGCEWDATG